MTYIKLSTIQVLINRKHTPKTIDITLFFVNFACISILRISIVRKFFVFFVLLAVVACSQKEEGETATMAPWTVVEEETANTDTAEYYTLEEILQSGEIRALTVCGERTYYEFDKAHLGVHYLLCEQLAQHLGVELKVEECKDSAEVVKKLRAGEGDIAMMPVCKTITAADSLLFCGPEEGNAQWAVMKYGKELADTIDHWFTPEMLAEAEQREDYIINVGAVQCHVYSPVLDKGKGVISEWDHLFKTYAQVASTDWRLLAAICYQESCFDPKARSWAGACGLMQIMPTTAESYGLQQEKIFDPESNVETAAKIINHLTMLYRDVPDSNERMNFVLASYNGGTGHVRDAMALTEKNGGNPYVWDEVAEYILLLSQPQYYRDAVVKCGYLRGTETHDYVYKVQQRYQDYTGVAIGPGSYGVNQSGGYAGVSTEPTRRESKENKYQI